ncbi:MAG: M4 family metallopeptidase [Verrucomicrobia bacterium]|nr:M4 family metallopeptidase [Verrucomicrobiota bacterium]
MKRKRQMLRWLVRLKEPTAVSIVRRACVFSFIAMVFFTVRTLGAPTTEDFAKLASQVVPAQARSAAAVPPATVPASFSISPRGFLKSISAPPSYHFPAQPGAAAQPPSAIARDFLLTNGSLFGVSPLAIDFREERARQSTARQYVRLQELYHGIPVVAAEAVVQLNLQNEVEAVLGDFEPEDSLANNGRTETQPRLSADAAVAKAKEAFIAQAAPTQIQTSTPQLAIFAPAVLDESGESQLVWDLEVSATAPKKFRYRVLVDAARGDIVRLWTLTPSALYRQILQYSIVSMSTNSCSSSESLVRLEGQPPSGIADADSAYTYLGDTYNFYLVNHGRDGFDGLGATNRAVVTYCQSCLQCPWNNAEADSFDRELHFGDGWAVDDIVAHEFTHLVTASESGLIYTNASGAINESFSDVWGEFVDLTNGHGADTPDVRWLIGEELALATLRSMKNPPQYNNPDRLGSPLYQPPSNTYDNGGVHENSGVNNKLCYLLTDGDAFNGQSVYGMGITRIADLYYEVQVNLLTSGAGWTELYQALRQAAINLGWNYSDRLNLYHACAAVEIAGPGANLYVDKSSTCPNPAGLASCVFPGIGPYLTVSQGLNAAGPADVVHVRTGNYNEPMTINQLVTIRAESGPVSIGKP